MPTHTHTCWTPNQGARKASGQEEQYRGQADGIQETGGAENPGPGSKAYGNSDAYEESVIKQSEAGNVHTQKDMQ